jgi:hypothetical protein
LYWVLNLKKEKLTMVYFGAYNKNLSRFTVIIPLNEDENAKVQTFLLESSLNKIIGDTYLSSKDIYESNDNNSIKTINFLKRIIFSKNDILFRLFILDGFELENLMYKDLNEHELEEIIKNNLKEEIAL